MKVALFGILVVVATAQAAARPKFLSDEYIKQINAQAETWTAGKNFPEGTSLSYIKNLVGETKWAKRVPEYKRRDFPDVEVEIPDSFDAREQWPSCLTIKQIVDQSACGSHWAIASASAISDRICIHSNGTKLVQISAADIISCCTVNPMCGKGCEGGRPYEAWRYWTTHGLVSGGIYHSGVGCKPYPFPQCSHHVNSTKFKPCPTKQYATPTCVKKCDTSLYTYEQDLHFGETYYLTKNTVDAIQKEILTGGPVTASFDLYEDFAAYKSGVYKRIPKSKWLGTHTAKILGWGVENGVEYWLAANSWNDSWGDKGFFKIFRGPNHVGIEDGIIAGKPRD